jgi:hypothetical protein
MARPKFLLMKIPLRNVLRCSQNDGGYESGECTACGETGWFAESGHGYPWSKVKFPYGDVKAGLMHKKNCAYGKLLKKDGSFK